MARQKLWDLASRVYPDEPVIPADEALRIRNERRLRALGIARARGPECPVEPADVGEAGEPAVVAGVKGTWRVDPSRPGQPFSGRAALLSPFDRLIHDRKRTVELFEFDYQLEMYKPAANRRWGYFALPILYGAEFVGKLDALADRTGRGAAGPRDPPGRSWHQGRDRGNRPGDQGPGALARAGPRAARLNAGPALPERRLQPAGGHWQASGQARTGVWLAVPGPRFRRVAGRWLASAGSGP